ncbi:serine hydrolase [Haladaptatus halobius]|uniref:serine hydrolase n=1 Tax=Haladaptatus halobius TaxID=2884875 RepID=UPI001D09EC7B|nr:serine hydrolase [Haladaptatus halobius]
MDSSKLSETDERALESLLVEWQTDHRVPGVSVAVVRDDEVVFVDGYGSRDLASNRPATSDTLYGVASVTKSFVALAIMRLQEAGDLRVTDPVADHLPVDPNGATIHDLLTHSSGMPSLGVSETLISRRAGLEEVGIPMADRGDFHYHVRNAADEVADDPGERFFYSNSGYMLLGEIIEARSGRSFDEYAADEILEPLEMARSTFDADEFESDDNVMTPYVLDEGKPEPTALPVRELSHAPGGLLSSVRELTNYLRFQMRGEFEGASPVSRDSLDAMHAGHVDTDAGPYGYGWRRRELSDRTVVGHSGSLGVSSSYLGFLAGGDYGVALAANTAPDHGLSALGEGVLALLLGANPEEPTPFFGRRKRLDGLTGEYEAYRGVKRATISRDGEVLRLAFEGPHSGSGVTLIPATRDIEDGEFYALLPSGERRTVTFEESDSGVDCFYERWRLHRV